MPDDKRSSYADLVESQKRFFREYEEDRSEGITLRSVHKMIATHIPEDAAFQKATVERLASLETNKERDRDDRLNGSARHIILPPDPGLPREVKPWYGRAPFKGIIEKGGLAVLAALAGWLLHHLTLR